MKDKDARAEIKRVGKQLDDLSTQLERLGSISPKQPFSVRDCPKCKHITLQENNPDPTYPEFYLVVHHDYTYDYICLVCGSKLKCVTETVCKVVKEKK